MSRWPFVSRAFHLAVREQMQARIDQMAHNMGEMRRQYDDLAARYHALRSTGAAPALVPAERPSAPADLAIEDVVEKFGGNPRLRRKLQKYRDEMRVSDATEDEIAHAIRFWRDPDSETA